MQKKVLLIEDDIELLETVKMMLSKMDLIVYAAKGVEEAMRDVTVREYDLIITDLYMTGVTDFSFVKAIKQCAIRPQTPLLIVSGVSREEIMFKELDGFFEYEYLSKPFRFGELKEKIYLLL